MTWNELAKRILEMTEGEREKTAYYREPYCDGTEMVPVDLYDATEDLTDPGGVVKVHKGETFLQ